MKDFKEYIAEVAYKDLRRCTAASVMAVAAHHNVDHGMSDNKAPLKGADALQHLPKIGLKKVYDPNQPYMGKSVSSFVKDHPTGAHIISTAGHMMAVTDGKLTDTANRGPDNRRKIASHFEIVKNS